MWWRYLVGMISGVALTAGGVLWWQGGSSTESLAIGAPPAFAATGTAPGEDAAPPQASEKTREEKRFSRYDKDRDGQITRDEYLIARRKAFAKLDKDGDGRLGFDEWAVKAETKFAGADKDRSGAMTPAEFVATKVARKTRPVTKCPPMDVKDEVEG